MNLHESQELMQKLCLILLVLIVSGCAVKVKTYQKPDQSFDAYKTWCWLEGCEVTYQGPDYLYDQRVVDEISNAVAYNMYQKGYEQSDETSDLMLNFFMIVEEDSAEVADNYDGLMPEIGWIGNLYPEYEKFLKGSLIIDVIDREKSEVIWRSNAVRYMELYPVYDKAEIWSAVEKAMKKLSVVAEPK
ncbi:DUF4136 domain-containing protein [Ekhidna sp. To15]|uniref:DUF4136 domain-containing protein n=1 Tax=Ekhidna sp. To15 TaxID=3395267 RepID=UPI003F52055B